MAYVTLDKPLAPPAGLGSPSANAELGLRFPKLLQRLSSAYSTHVQTHQGACQLRAPQGWIYEVCGGAWTPVCLQHTLGTSWTMVLGVWVRLRVCKGPLPGHNVQGWATAVGKALTLSDGCSLGHLGCSGNIVHSVCRFLRQNRI